MIKVFQKLDKKFNEYKSEIERKFTNLNNNFERELKSSNQKNIVKYILL